MVPVYEDPENFPSQFMSFKKKATQVPILSSTYLVTVTDGYLLELSDGPIPQHG